MSVTRSGSAVPSSTAVPPLGRLQPRGRKQLLSFGIFAALALTAIVVAGLWDNYDAKIKNAEERSVRSALAAELHVRGTVDNARSALDIATAEVEKSALDTASFESAAGVVLKPDAKNQSYVLNMIVANPDGRVVYSSREPDIVARGVTISDRDYFVAARNAGPRDIFVGIPLQSRVTGDSQWIIPLSRRLTAADGTFAGVVVAAISADEIEAFFESIRSGPNGVVGIGRMDGTVIVREPLKMFGQNFTLPEIPDPIQGTIRANGPTDHVPRIYSYHVNGDLGTVVFVGIALKDVASEWRRDALIPLAVWLVCIATIAFFTAALMRQESRRALAEDVIREKESDLRAIMEHAPIGIFFKDLDLRYRLINRILRNWSKVTTEIEQHDDLEIVPEHEAELRRTSDRQVLAQGKMVSYQRDDIPFNAPVEKVQILKFPVRGDDGEIAGIAGLVFDITERERNQQALAFERALSDAVEHDMPGFFLLFDENRRAIRWNRNIEILTGPLSDWSGQPDPLSLIAEGDRVAIRSLVESTFRDGRAESDGRLTSASGDELEFIFNAQRIENGGRRYVVLTGMDVSERNRAEKSLRHTERVLQTLRRANRLLVQATDEQYLVAEMCRVIVDIGGYRMAYIGYAEHDDERTIRPVAYAGFENGYLQETRGSWSEGGAGGRGRIGLAIRSGVLQINHDFMNDDGTREWRDAALQRGYRSNVSLPLREGNAVFGALSIYAAETEAFDTTEVALLSELADNLSYGIGALRTRARSEAATDRLLQAEKSLAISTLASSIAHDFNNLLAVILGFSSLAAERTRLLADEGRADWRDVVAKLSGVNAALEHIVTSATHGRRIVESMNKLIKTHRTEVETVDLWDVVQSAEPFMRVLLPAFIQLDMKGGDARCEIEADAVQLEQMIFNLCINAVHAIGERRGRVTVSVDRLDIDTVRENRIKASSAKSQDRGMDVRSTADHGVEILTAQLADAPHVRLTVSDNGCGISAEIAQKIFTPFFTTKEPGRGTGLGLNSILEIVKAHGGAVHVRSQVGVGTDFMVFLPEKTSGSGIKQRPQARIRPGREPVAEMRINPAILVVDDEQTVVDMVTAVLDASGYDVSGLTDPLAALELLRRVPDAFDLVITDQTMPRLLGSELVSHIHAIRADLPVIISTGFSAEKLSVDESGTGIAGLLAKPYTPAELLAAVRAALAIR